MRMSGKFAGRLMPHRIDEQMASFFDTELSASIMQRRSCAAKHNRHTKPPPQKLQERQEDELPPSPFFDAYVVLDFEATCERNRRLEEPEIIEFPMVLIDARSHRILTEFQRYVRPVVNPILSDFCTELTGIKQSVVDAAEKFPLVFDAALEFLRGSGYGEAPPLRSYLFVTCGDWDLKTMLPSQLRTTEKTGTAIVAPPTFRRWCNLKVPMRAIVPTEARGMFDLREMLAAVGLPLKGRHHSGIDDCRNIASVVQELLRRGHVIAPTTDHSGIRQRESSLSRAEDGPLTGLREGTRVPKKHAEKRSNAPMMQEAGVPERPHLKIISEEDPLPALLKNSNLVLEEAKKVTYSKTLTRILRHAADKMGIPVSSGGFVHVDHILRCKPFCNDPLALSHIALVVHTNDKKRFKMAYDDHHRLYIRANQGHSLAGIDPELRRIESATEMPAAIHGTYYSAWKEICACGYLSTMTRQHIHFSRGLISDHCVISGMRSNVEVLLYLDVAKVLADGIELWESENGVLLTPGMGSTKRLPLTYISKVVDRKTGQTLAHD
ncbi:putative phosphotransferase [Trypanosoma cruzi]|nr:putative phosphotransferase [Trypanosoma cruzi]